jgi:SAM-dependent MidA family methyltransferase
VPALKPWIDGWQEAAFGPDGFYQQQSPYAHFATSVSQDALAPALLPYLLSALDHLDSVTVVDVGAGNGDLGVQLHDLLNENLRLRVHFLALDLGPRPIHLPEFIQWRRGNARETIATIAAGNMILIAHEFLDDLPCDVVEVDEAGLVRLGKVEENTQELTFGQELRAAEHQHQLQWLADWWPVQRPLMRAEVGRSRDEFWNLATSRITAGYGIAIDYGHIKADRARGLWDGGTLTGYRDSMTVSPTANNSVNLTAHVAIDAIAAASAGNPLIRTFRLGPTPDFWWTVAAYEIEFPQPDKMPT